MHTDPSKNVYGSPLEVVDPSILDYDTDVAADTEVHHDENVVSLFTQYADNTNAPIDTEVAEVPTASSPINNQPVRRTSRSIKKPVLMKDYTATGKKQSSTKHPIANSLSYDKVTPCYKVFLSKFSECIEPKHFHQAVKNDRWIQAMQQDIRALEENNT
ncbi:hypothetical protein KY290_027784 [Solanum tuberosum]|uniref:Integrase core domain containing protein n=1 Tax=Solanum tuberosum TaxID=4113 RepID=A0ABQ7UHU3_SOLTU|nr:hypothetical protein KY290_027784 [Solanum tuberosum]